MLYHIKKIDNDTLEHHLAGHRTRESGISQIEDLQAYLQNWVDQRKTIFPIKKITNDYNLDLKLR